ncbi:MAG: BREX-1 system phosphatase PglZ type B [Planctomycetes bacterium]|nr:BREX-1 system phosphatase PglZ type B [Planctomycetota bacterium]NOG54184.1 BREX-1 system phosphatase PglZ type B [Planctomycetota bacterium]
MSSYSGSTRTLLEAVRASLSRAVQYNVNVMVAPAAVLWADPDGQWTALVEMLRGVMAELITLGEYDAESRTGPAIWLRCVIEPDVRTDKFPDMDWPAETVPVIYMPGVSRQILRAVEECPDSHKPLVELQYRGTVWTQKNGKDWTVRAFLVSDDGGLGLEVAEDKQTLQAMLGALSQLAVTPIERLRGKVLEAEDFDKLMIGDAPRDLLLWLSDPDGTRARWDSQTWSAFCNRCNQDYDFDPVADGELIGGEKLGLRQHAWFGAWERFAESPMSYAGIPDLLRRAKPKGELTFDKEPWPDVNDSMEDSLRTALLAVGSMKPAEARERLIELDKEHGSRRGWVWAQLGQCPLAVALKHLTVLADRASTVVGGDTTDTMAKVYTAGAYLADDAVLQALACVKAAADVAAVQAVIRSVYMPWLDDTALNFQKCLEAQSLSSVSEQDAMSTVAGDCILFVDGLRFDLGQRLADLAGERKMQASVRWRWAALPTVTATAKPAVTPVADQVVGKALDSDFCPESRDSGKKLIADRLRQLLKNCGYEVLGSDDTGDPQAKDARAWTECGEFDKLGHSLQGKLAAQVDLQLAQLLDRLRSLLDAGWKRVRVVTDHGWFLVPGGTPKAELPKYLVESRWARCASIKDSSHVDVPVAGWFWNPLERFAHAPGIQCFTGGNEYAHGGVSLQECVIPVLMVSGTGIQSPATVSVTDVHWAGLRCRVKIEPAVEGLSADIRTKPNVAGSSITDPKALDSDGKAALLVADESLEGTTISVVIVDGAGKVLCKEATTVGGDR